MPLEIVMPKLGLTMTEGLIVEWKKAEGDQVRRGEILFVLETEKARERFDIEIGRFSFHGSGKTLVLNETFGMVKIISEKRSGRVLGVHMIGPHATDMIGEAVLGMSMKMTVQELARAVHPHPSLSEAVMESALSLCGGATHMP